MPQTREESRQDRTREPEPVDVALVLAVDISFSMTMHELALQRDGYVASLSRSARALPPSPPDRISASR